MPVCGTGPPGGEPPAAGERPMATQAELGVPGVALDIEDHAVVALEAVDAAKVRARGRWAAASSCPPSRHPRRTRPPADWAWVDGPFARLGTATPCTCSHRRQWDLPVCLASRHRWSPITGRYPSCVFCALSRSRHSSWRRSPLRPSPRRRRVWLQPPSSVLKARVRCSLSLRPVTQASKPSSRSRSSSRARSSWSGPTGAPESRRAAASSCAKEHRRSSRSGQRHRNDTLKKGRAEVTATISQNTSVPPFQSASATVGPQVLVLEK
jgi:hypothetical protein